MRPLFIVGTQRDIGKTTTSIGLLHAFRRRGLSVGYMKPLGQRIKGSAGHVLHDDAMLIASVLGRQFDQELDTAIPLPSGRVEKELEDLDSDALRGRVREFYERLASQYDAIVVESMGHVAAGSCLGVSSAEVAVTLNARTLLISGGGIGRALDEIALCSTFLTARGADLVGVVVNKVWRSKYDRVKHATGRGLAYFGLDCFGVVPFEEMLASPTVHQVYGHVGGELIAGRDYLENRVRNTIVAAMETEHMMRYLKAGTLVITPGDRSDNIHAALSAHMLGEKGKGSVSGLILTGGIAPGAAVKRLIDDARLPVVLSDEDTYSVASRLRESVFKITPEDHDRIEQATRVIGEHVDVDRLVELMDV
ncbi:MAG: AAA family ATPase [Phycisphaerae bacterium]|nr:AAA family ATPase [Phycisphaerae bacterium]